MTADQKSQNHPPRPHDMGGRFGDGAVIPDDDAAPVFTQDWHGRALALTLAAGALGAWNLDISRHARECLKPEDYSRFSYYEKWLAALADLLHAHGVVRLEELQSGQSSGVSPLASKQLSADRVAAVLAAGGPTERPQATPPKFNIGQAVKTRIGGNAMVEGGHTRLPRYAQGKPGLIIAHHGPHIFPDSHAHGQGEAPQHLYGVAFRAQDLWDAPEHPEDDVILELWESYLEA